MRWALPAALAVLALAGVAEGCADEDCVPGGYTLNEQTAGPDLTCGEPFAEPIGADQRVVCQADRCSELCPVLRLTDGTPIPPSECTHSGLTSNGSGATGGAGGGGGGSSGGGGMGGSSPPTSWLQCRYDLDVDWCSTRQQAQPGPAG